MDFSLDTSEKIVSLIVGAIAIGSFLFVRNKKTAENLKTKSTQNSQLTGNQTVTVNVGGDSMGGAAQTPAQNFLVDDIPSLKRSVRVLFIDDDRGFKIVGVLKKMGWEHTKIVTDITSLEQAALAEAHVVFVDIQGVGRAMQYVDEGLGLALAIKRRHGEKKVVIYSAQEEGARFHEAFQVADYSLPKTAEPIRFEDTIVRVLKG